MLSNVNMTSLFHHHGNGAVTRRHKQFVNYFHKSEGFSRGKNPHELARTVLVAQSDLKRLNNFYDVTFLTTLCKPQLDDFSTSQKHNSLNYICSIICDTVKEDVGTENGQMDKI